MHLSGEVLPPRSLLGPVMPPSRSWTKQRRSSPRSPQNVTRSGLSWIRRKKKKRAFRRRSPTSIRNLIPSDRANRRQENMRRQPRRARRRQLMRRPGSPKPEGGDCPQSVLVYAQPRFACFAREPVLPADRYRGGIGTVATTEAGLRRPPRSEGPAVIPPAAGPPFPTPIGAWPVQPETGPTDLPTATSVPKPTSCQGPIPRMRNRCLSTSGR
jgi:hypothetical protein